METMSAKVHPVKSKIQSFYEGKAVFLTGGTGFLGKVLIEKLLRSCPDIKQIYLLVREKKGEKAEERLKKLLDCQVFTNLKLEHPDFAQKITLLPGDLSLPQLGLSPQHVDVILQNVEIVFHSAATLRFDERLSIAINTNLSATKKLCLLAQNMANLQAFIYVSTAYCDCDKPLVEEKVPKSRISPETLMELPDLLGEDTMDEVTPILLGSKPNTYIFTKCAAEEVIDTFKMSLPVAVFRPSIVLSGVSEPIPGWIDNILGPTGMTASLLAGLVHTAHFNYTARANLVPVDYVVNGIIALGYSVGQEKWETPDQLQIVNFVSTADNTITWGQFSDLLKASVWESPSSKLVWYPFGVEAKYHWSYAIMKGLFHTIPAYIIDCLSAVIGRPTRLKEFYRKLDKYAAVTRHFAMTEFNFEERNAKNLWNSLDTVDQEMFPFNMASLDWNIYMRTYVKGCRRFLLKEDPETIERSRKKIRMLYIIHLVASSTFFLMFLRIVIFAVRLIGKKSNLPIQQGRQR